MAEVREVNIKLDDSFTGPVCDFSVGFLRFEKRDNGNEVGVPVGTGTFVKIGKVYGGQKREWHRRKSAPS